VTAHKQQEQDQSFQLKKERIATECMCCFSENITSSPAILMPFVAHRAFGWQPVVIDDFDYRGDEYSELRESYEPGYKRRNDNLNSISSYIGEVEKFLGPHLLFPITILNWGGDTGKNTPFINKYETLDIYDISGKEVVTGASLVSKDEAQSKKYNLIICSNVLEHVPYPSELLLDIKKSMDNNSLLYIEVPLENVMINNKNSPHLDKKHWHEHINFFSKKSLVQLLTIVDLEIIDLSDNLEIKTEGKSSYLFQIACKLKSC